MMRLLTGLIVICVICAVGGFAFLASWEMPRTTKKVEKVIPNERFYAKEQEDKL